jgi:O-antigen/teichoic acid export membrane protein
MRIRDLLAGIVSGYLSKAIQFAVSLALVPFFLRSDVLGLDGFGRASAILAAVQLATVATDGLRISFTRGIARALADARAPVSAASLIGSGSLLLAVLTLTFAIAIGATSEPILRAIGIEATPDTRWALWLAVALFAVENSLNLVQAPLLTRGSIRFVNGVVTAETLLRALVFALALGWWPHSISAYIAAFLITALLRQAILVVALWRSAPEDLRGATRARLADAWPSLRYSLPLTAYWGTLILLQRAPIVIASQFLGAEASGMLALVIATIRGYFHQILFSVLQPLEVPVGSIVDPQRLSPGARATLWDLEAIYLVAVSACIAGASAIAPGLIALWLGPGYSELVWPCQLVLLGSGVELGLSIRRSILTGQGFFGVTARRFAIAGALTLIASAGSAVTSESWSALAACFAAFLVAANCWAIAAPFDRAFRGAAGPHWTRIPLFLCACSGVAIGVSMLFGGGSGLREWVGLPLSLALVAIGAHALLIPFGRAIASLRRLRALGDRSLIDPGPASSEAPLGRA